MISDPVRVLLNVPGVIELSCKKKWLVTQYAFVERPWSPEIL